MTDAEAPAEDERPGSLGVFLNRYIQVKWVLPPFIVLGLLSTWGLQRTADINEARGREAAVKVYEQCLLSHNAGIANKALQQSIVDSTRLIATSIHSIIAAATADVPVDPTDPRSVAVQRTLDELDQQIDESQAKVDAIAIRDCTPLKPNAYTPSEVG